MTVPAAKGPGTAAVPDDRHLLFAITNHLPGMVAYWDAGLICRFANSAYLEWFGRTQGEMIGLSIQTLLGPELFERNRPYIDGAMAGRRQAFERALTKANGDRGYTWAQYIPDIDDAGLVRGMYVLVTDITALRNTSDALQTANLALEKARREAEAAAEAKGAFLASMSHEIRTPLTSIIGYAGLLTDVVRGNVDAERFSRRISESGGTLLTLVNDILDHAKLGSGLVRLDIRPDNIVGLMSDIVDLLGIQARQKGLALDLVVEPGLPEILMIDAPRLRQVLHNLVGNAVKFTHSGKIEIRARYQPDGRLKIAVGDTGIGISAAGRKKLFQPFSQIERRDSPPQHGTGLGLMICRQIVSLMHGRVTVKSRLGTGSVFTIEIPAPTPAATPRRRLSKAK